MNILDWLFGTVEDTQPLNIIDCYVTNLKDIPYNGADNFGNDSHLDSLANLTVNDNQIGKQVE